MSPQENDNTLLLGFFKKHVLTQRRIELHKLDLAFHAFFILTRPNYMLGLRGLEFKKTVL